VSFCHGIKILLLRENVKRDKGLIRRRLATAKQPHAANVENIARMIANLFREPSCAHQRHP
jgi:hypothetical protein